MARRAPRHRQRRQLRRRARCRGRQQGSGLVSLDWLLVIAAVGGLAAVMAIAVQRLVVDAAEVETDGSVRLIEARVQAAQLSEAVNVELESAQGRGAPDAAKRGCKDPPTAKARRLCERCRRLTTDYGGDVKQATWRTVPTTTTTATTAPDATLADETATAVTTPRPLWTCQVTGRSS